MSDELTKDEVHAFEIKLLSLETEIHILKEKTQVRMFDSEDMHMGLKALETSIHNTLLAFGALRERVDGFSSTFKYHVEGDDTRLSQIEKSNKNSIEGFSKLCNIRCKAVIGTTDHFRQQIHILVSANQDDILKLVGKTENLEGRINNWLWVMLVACLGYLAKMLFIVNSTGSPQ